MMNGSTILLVRQAKVRKSMCKKSSSNLPKPKIKDTSKPDEPQKLKKVTLLEVDE